MRYLRRNYHRTLSLYPKSQIRPTIIDKQIDFRRAGLTVVNRSARGAHRHHKKQHLHLLKKKRNTRRIHTHTSLNVQSSQKKKANKNPRKERKQFVTLCAQPTFSSERTFQKTEAHRQTWIQG